MKPRALQACEAQMPLDVDQNNHTAMQLPQEAKRKLQRSSERATSSSNENIMDLWQTIAGSTTSNSIEQTSSVAPFRSRHQEKALSSGVVVAVYTHPTKENDDKTRFLRDRCDRPQKVCAMGLVTDTNHLKERPFKGRDAEDRAVLMQFSGNYDRLQARFPEKADCMAGQSSQNGSGENVEVRGLTIEKTCIGDIFAVVPSPAMQAAGRRSAPLLVEVTSPRKPCQRWNQRYDTETTGPRSMRVYVMKNTLGGCFFRVLRDGDICAGDTLVLQHRPLPEWPISRVGDLLYGHINGFEESRDDEETAACASIDDLRALKNIPQLGIREWKDVIEEVLAEKEERESEVEKLLPAKRIIRPVELHTPLLCSL